MGCYSPLFFVFQISILTVLTRGGGGRLDYEMDDLAIYRNSKEAGIIW